jgi:hypothetical protein
MKSKTKKKKSKPQKKKDMEITLKSKPPIKLVYPYIPEIGEEVLIVTSSVSYAVDKIGTVEKYFDGGYAVKIKTKKVNAEDYGALENKESEAVVWAETVKPYIPIPSIK